MSHLEQLRKSPWLGTVLTGDFAKGDEGNLDQCCRARA